MPDPTPPPRAMTVNVGDTVTVQPKNPLTSKTTYAVVTAVVSFGVTKLVSKGYIPAALHDLVGDAAVEWATFALGNLALAAAWFARWAATRKLGFGGPQATTIK